jgi:hypothetical protein
VRFPINANFETESNLYQPSYLTHPIPVTIISPSNYPSTTSATTTQDTGHVDLSVYNTKVPSTSHFHFWDGLLIMPLWAAAINKIQTTFLLVTWLVHYTSFQIEACLIQGVGRVWIAQLGSDRATGWTSRVRLLAMQDFSSSLNHTDRLWGPNNLPSNGYWGSLSEGKAAGA